MMEYIMTLKISCT